jgi:hypothetical protein
MAGHETMQVRVVAQDPMLTHDGAIVTDLVTFPYEDVEAGPIGHRVHVVDYDSSTATMYPPAPLKSGGMTANVSKRTILATPDFHAQNVYGLVMSTVARFERALGRRAPWGFSAHQIKVVPHAFAVANAFYSPDAEALLFGYYERDGKTVFTCLSHDVVVHETTHALLDGMRRRFTRPSSPDQAAFHEAFADVVALLSIFSMPKVVEIVVDQAAAKAAEPGETPAAESGLVGMKTFDGVNLVNSALFGIAEQLDDLNPDFQRVGALRRSVTLMAEPGILDLPQFAEPHRRGEIVVAAIMQTFLAVWQRRLQPFRVGNVDVIDRTRAIEEGAAVADQLLTMCIRGLDYTPPVHIDFSDFLSAVLTADREVRPNDTRLALRSTLRETFMGFGVGPTRGGDGEGCWSRVEDGMLRHEGVRFSNAQSDPTEMFRLIWANRTKLQLPLTAYCRIADLAPCLRIAPEDGLPVRETIAICLQYVKVPASDLGQFGLRRPSGMPETTEVALEGGSTLILDEYGKLKYEITQPIPTKGHRTPIRRTQRRLDFMWGSGAFLPGASLRTGLSAMHRTRALGNDVANQEAW